MANYIDAEYDKKTDPTKIIVWEQDYDTGEIIEKEYPIKDYLYFYVDAVDETKAVPNLTSQRGTKVQKVKAKDFKSYSKRTEAIEVNEAGLNTYESDISPLDKALLDNYGKDNQKAPEWNLALYDIETDILTEQSFMEMRDSADREITAISVWYSSVNKFFELVLVPETLREFWDYTPIQRGEFEVFYFDNEAELLETFFALNKETNTVALGAWNGDFFDTGYIFKRAKKHWGEKGAAIRMGRFPKVRKNKVTIGNNEENLIYPIGMIWYDALEAYKVNGPELESFALAVVAEHEGVPSKVDFEGDFETLYHGSRELRKKFKSLFKTKNRVKELNDAIEIFEPIAKDLYPEKFKEVQDDETLVETEKETRANMMVTEQLDEMLQDEEFTNSLGEMKDTYELYITYRKLVDTLKLFEDYSMQDSKILYDLEIKLRKFNTLMMLAQYNVSLFNDVFGTLKQAEQGITNFAHLNNKVVMDRDYIKSRQPYNKYVDKELLRIREEHDFKVYPDDPEEIKEMKILSARDKIAGAHVLLPQIGLISVDDETPELARKFKSLKAELEEIERELAELED